MAPKNFLAVLRDSLGLALLLTLFVHIVNGTRSFGESARTFSQFFIYAMAILLLAGLVFRKLWPAFEHSDDSTQRVTFVLIMIAISAIGSLLGTAVLALLELTPPAPFSSTLQTSFKISLFLSLVTGINEAAYEHLRGELEQTQLRLRSEELSRERALTLAAEARLGALESRIHPHFLFNTLNSISSLIPADPERAERLVGRMASLLRFSLDSHNGGLVEWEQECKVVRDYLEIEQARLGTRLRYRVKTAHGLSSFRVPPLSVQTLVENSIKYAVAPALETSEIVVEAERQGDHVNITVSDTGPGFLLEAAPPGHGLDILRARLAATYGAAAALQVARHDRWTAVTLQVPA